MHDWPSVRLDEGYSESKWSFWAEIRDRCRLMMVIRPRGEASFDAQLNADLGSDRGARLEGTLRAKGNYMGNQPERIDIPVSNPEGA
jgi:hypothetical protein